MEWIVGDVVVLFIVLLVLVFVMDEDLFYMVVFVIEDLFSNEDRFGVGVWVDVFVKLCCDVMFQGVDGDFLVILDVYDIEVFGVFSVFEGEDGLLLQIENFRFGMENCL